MKYSIVIPTYNHCDDLLRPCIESILKYTNVADIELIISANGCTDTTFEYLGMLKEKYTYLGLRDNLKLAWANEPLGYSRACNEGIKLATCDLVILLNNDAVLLEQPRNTWTDLLAAQFEHTNCGISCLIKGFSEPAGQDFAVFFCVMIHKKVFDKIGLLPLDYGVGGGEDTEFSIECERAGFEVREAVVKRWSNEAGMYVGDFPIYHKGEGTVHDATLVPQWNKIFDENSLTLAKKYNPAWYQWKISNNAERGVFFKNDIVFPREAARYKFAVEHLKGPKVLEVGCSSGFGVQFFHAGVEYTGIDNDAEVIVAAKNQQWSDNANFVCADINQWLVDNNGAYFDNIIAYESIEHISNGLEVVEKLKRMCDRMFITVPFNENPGQFSPHHRIHNLTISKFPGFIEHGLLDINGKLITDKSIIQPGIEYNLLMEWSRQADSIIEVLVVEVTAAIAHTGTDLSWLARDFSLIYNEVIRDNVYMINSDMFSGAGEVIDVGANVGIFSLYAASLGAKKILSVEPTSATYAKLKENIQRSGFNNITPIKKLVSKTRGETCKLSLNEQNGANSMYNVVDEFEVVHTMALSDLLNQMESNDITLKLDCEGAEYDILLNASQYEMSRVSRVLLEMHTDLHPVHKGAEILENKLSEFGFTKYDHKQVFTWMVNERGEQYDMKPIPYCIQLWKR